MKKEYIIGIATILIFVFGIIIFTPKGFRVESTIPKAGGEGPVETDVLIYFDRPINSVNNISIQPNISFTYRIENDRILRILPDEILVQDTEYTVTLNQVESSDESNSIDYSMSFKAVYVPYDQLPEDGSISSLTATTSFENVDPLFAKLPQTTSEYSISVTNYGSDTTKPVVRVELYAILNNPSQYDEFKKTLNDYKANALEYINANSEDINNYTIEFYPNPADYN